MVVTKEYLLAGAISVMLLISVGLMEGNKILEKGNSYKVSLRVLNPTVARTPLGVQLRLVFQSTSNKPIYVNYIVLKDSQGNEILFGDRVGETCDLPIRINPSETFLFSAYHRVDRGFMLGKVTIIVYYSLGHPAHYNPNSPYKIFAFTEIAQAD